jgi:phosphoribosylformylglycinamidine synthase
MWQFSETIDGIAEACNALEIPITGGNVSFYNETLGKPIYPTPVLGVLGVLEDAERALGLAFQHEGDLIVLLDGSGKWAQEARSMSWKNFTDPLRASIAPSEELRAFSSSEYAKTIQGVVAGTPPALDLAAEKRLIACLVALASESAIFSAHDVGDGGLAVTLAECCFGGNALSAEVLSADISLGGTTDGAHENAPAEAALFGERGARAVVSLSPAALARVNEIAAQYKVSTQRIGTVTAGEFRIQYNGYAVIRGDVTSLRRAWSESLQKAIENA